MPLNTSKGFSAKNIMESIVLKFFNFYLIDYQLFTIEKVSKLLAECNCGKNLKQEMRFFHILCLFLIKRTMCKQ
jgi:hypothetical protein